MQGLVNLSQCAALGNILNQINGVIIELVDDSHYTKEDAANELMVIARSIHEEMTLKQF
ncbi:hypothetical protein LSG31_00675 [Fodinisporobacter ferrooxydans]|uniref:Uncharacterized protein n=1 Tax=Fodinisporobacter ferrooxydans TaxID=2901836 RepID=A0ABY4CN13_9BACL|nr:hypothetical protein LSG31_00675 [Alicyclobacillaceae bacterium MYW30-H2]